MARYTNKEKAAECRRELGKRRHVYARAVAEQKMKQTDADRLIGLMEDMQADYERLDGQDRPDMFAGETSARCANALDLAEKLRGFAKFGETYKRRDTMNNAAALLEEFARGSTEGTGDALSPGVDEPAGQAGPGVRG